MDVRHPAMQARASLVPQQRAAMLQFMSLLPLAAADIEALVSRALEENPALERESGWACVTCGRFCRGVRCEPCSRSFRPPDRAAVVDWRRDLRERAGLELSGDLLPYLDVVLDSLDDHGLLQGLVVDDPRLRSVLGVLRDVGPPGIAARSAVECVRLQVEVLVARGAAPRILLDIVGDWLPEVAEGRFADIAAALGVDEEDVRHAVTVLTTSTRPFVALDAPAPRPGPVDVEFSLDGDRLLVSVVDVDVLGLRLVDDVGPMDADALAWLRPHREAASRLIAAVSARARMLTRVAELLAVRQRDYLVRGRHHRPLRRAELAAELGVHPSTVGRVVAGKVARCPDGRVVPLESLFGAGPSTLELVGDAVADLPGATDAALATELARRGTPLARRTVAKYRARLGNASANRASQPTRLRAP